jgi:ATP-dependent Clp protease protease subunit
MEYMTNTDYLGSFREYAVKHMGVTSMQFHYWEQLQNSLYSNSRVMSPSNNMTPMILEEREMRATQMSVFDRNMMDRIIWVCGPVNDVMSTVTAAQLMWLDSENNNDITMHIDSPGGSVKSGLVMVDVMNYVISDITTVNIGMAASMGSILLGNGAKGKRFALPSSKVMLHQISAGMQGTYQDMEISFNESKKYNDQLFEMLGDYTDKTAEQVKKDADRDLWLSATEASDYGIIDGIITKKRR